MAQKGKTGYYIIGRDQRSGDESLRVQLYKGEYLSDLSLAVVKRAEKAKAKHKQEDVYRDRWLQLTSLPKKE
jgi:hypothetical protein